jgi:hypothetical protein
MPSKSNGKKPRALARPSSTLSKRSLIAREQAATDYITDPNACTVRHVYERTDREYNKLVAWPTFEGWASADKWTGRRDKFWVEIEQRVVVHMQDKILKDRVTEMKKLSALSEIYEEMLLPLRDDDGNVKRDAETGLPQFGLKLPSMDKFARMWLALHERLMLMRGEAIGRTETSIEPGEGKITALAGPGGPKVKLSRTEVQAMARTLLRERQPELAQDIDSPLPDGETPE